MNSIDTKLLAAAKIRDIPLNGPEAPQSVFEARTLLFEEELKDMEKLSHSIRSRDRQADASVDHHCRRW